MTTKATSLANIEHDTSRKIGNNTFEYTLNGTRVIRLHHTDIMTFNDDGSVTLNSGGWTTPTTKDRMNNYMPPGWSIYQKSFIWYLQRLPYETGTTYIYADGMTLHMDGTATGAGTLPDKELIKRIKAYCKAFAAALPVEQPGGGDCFGCSMFGEAGNPDTGHLLQHIEESYFVPTLLVRAMKAAGCGKAWYWAAFKQFVDPNEKTYTYVGFGVKVSSLVNHDALLGDRSQFRRWLYKYIYARVIDGRRNHATT